MARLYLHFGLEPDAPDAPVAVLVVDPEGAPGERAVARLGDSCHEVDEWACLLQTDGWAERAYVDGWLAVAIAVYPSALLAAHVDPADFADRSAVDPDAVVILRTRTTAAPEAYAGLSEGTVVFTTNLDIPLDELIAAYDDWPMLLAPPPDA